MHKYKTLQHKMRKEIDKAINDPEYEKKIQSLYESSCRREYIDQFDDYIRQIHFGIFAKKTDFFNKMNMKTLHEILTGA